jgi:hypothetical protein
MYRIRWRSLLTGLESHGSWFDDADMLNRAIASANLRHKNEIHHWLEYNL